MLITFDVLRRYLEFQVIRLSCANITDKMIKLLSVLKKKNPLINLPPYIQVFQEDCAALGIKPPTYQPKATEVIPDIIDAIKLQIQKALLMKLMAMSILTLLHCLNTVCYLVKDRRITPEHEWKKIL